MYVCIIYKYTNIQCISYCTIIDNRTMRNKYIFILVLFKIEIKRQNGQNTIGIIKYFKVTVISCWSYDIWWDMLWYMLITLGWPTNLFDCFSSIENVTSCHSFQALV